MMVGSGCLVDVLVVRPPNGEGWEGKGSVKPRCLDGGRVECALAQTRLPGSRFRVQGWTATAAAKLAGLF